MHIQKRAAMFTPQKEAGAPLRECLFRRHRNLPDNNCGTIPGKPQSLHTACSFGLVRFQSANQFLKSARLH